jgi:peptidoglycan hydrolase-like protein with peptidoglycan-binding domain
MVTTTRSAPSRPITTAGRDPSVQDQPRSTQATKVDDDVVPYTVKSGETLNDIARRHDCSLEELLELNPAFRATPNKVRAGTNIDVPAADKIAKPEKKPVAADVQQSSRARAAAGEAAIRARIEGAYSIPAPSFEEIRAGDRMRRGMGGESVKQLQQRLNDLGARPPLEVDGKFGPKTEAALKRFQSNNSVQQTGVLGPTTLEALEKAKPDENALDSARGVSLDGVKPGTLADRLGDAAEREAKSMNTKGKCALGVNNALIYVGVSGRGHAYQKAEQLAASRASNSTTFRAAPSSSGAARRRSPTATSPSPSATAARRPTTSNSR